MAYIGNIDEQMRAECKRTNTLTVDGKSFHSCWFSHYGDRQPLNITHHGRFVAVCAHVYTIPKKQISFNIMGIGNTVGEWVTIDVGTPGCEPTERWHYLLRKTGGVEMRCTEVEEVTIYGNVKVNLYHHISDFSSNTVYIMLKSTTLSDEEVNLRQHFGQPENGSLVSLIE
jgi:hypothetical protein